MMNIIAQAAYEKAGEVIVMAFAVMNNHFHFVLSGDIRSVNEMLSFLLKRTKRVFKLDKILNVSSKPIEDLASVRNHIVYVHRNGYVTNPEHTPFSYPWGSGAYYYTLVRNSIPFSDLTSIENRSMFHSRDVKLPSEWQVINEHSEGNSVFYIAPPSFCAIRLGMSMFRDAHHYFAAISKNVEAYSGIAEEIDDGEFLTDQELFSKLLQIVREKYRIAAIRDLTNAQKLDIARVLHYEYRSSNGQIRRLLGLTQYDVDRIFPLSKA
ncbi:MAG: hypothetical protein MJY62_05630 [Bacteroidales bacterium]|nr:hypothetical protein [Bacteroidales bacterium]